MIKPKRVLTIGLFILFTLLVFIGRLAQIQLVEPTSFSKYRINLIQSSINQRTSQFIFNNGRGTILDRHLKPLTNHEQLSLVLFPFLKYTDWPAGSVADILKVPKSQLIKAVNSAHKPFVFKQGHLNISNQQKRQIEKLKVLGVHVMMVQSNDDRNIDPQVIGLVRQNSRMIEKRYGDLLNKGVVSRTVPTGINGLQKAFDPFLLSQNESMLLYHTDAKGMPLFGNSIRYTAPSNPFYPLRVVSTLDKDIQQLAEKAVNRAGLEKGGVVILDVDNSNLLGMVSRPQIDNNHPYQTNSENQMLMPQFPGSVFKIVTAAAAIQENDVHSGDTFNCNLDVYGEKPAQKQLGTLSFDDSFYQSCNYTFAHLANLMTKNHSNVINDYADLLGLTGKSGWSGDVYHFNHFEHFPDEKTNTIWINNEPSHNKKAIGQTAIGQLNVKLTPLSVANMMATIARNGVKQYVRAASKIIYHQDDHMTLASFPHKSIKGQKLESYTIIRLQQLLRGVVKSPEGTAHYYLSGLPYPVAGKSGTAQTGRNDMNNWFAGYFPADHPHYAMVVVDLNQRHGEEKTYQIYRQIVKSLYQLDMRKSSN
ncbi:penicillin-binding transpeptidase domain-containing protein [Scopulibacillus cellulosilyticus]|uniref:Penicillin-binding transpeptidase domain-containing protein n=1 Tax=Scopulibacillus cellulosilyticus TaxID=2665665 RepID=A0ABW2PV54_9BACL